MKPVRLVLIAALAALAGCGKIAPLEPARGQSLPVKPAMASATPDAEQLLTPPPYAKPERIDELMKRRSRAAPTGSTCRRRAAKRRSLPETQEENSSEASRAGDAAMSWKPVRKAVFPVAGLGTRLLPATKSIPKEMLTIVDRPLIQYAVDEAREAGIEQMIFVTGRGKAALDDYFDIGFELEATMRERGKSLDALAPSRSRLRRDRLGPPAAAAWASAMRSGARATIVGDEPFAVLLPDDLMVGAGCAEADGRGLCRSSAAISCAPRKCAGTDRQLRHHHPGRNQGRARPRSRGWSRSRSRRTRRQASASSAATSCSRRSWACSSPGKAAPAARSS